MLDNDLIHDLDYEGNGVEFSYFKIIKWLMTEFNRVVLSHKEHLPNKSRKYKFPAFIWIEPPLNKNFYNNDLRRLFGKAMQLAVLGYSQMWSLQLKRVWEYMDTRLYDHEV